MRAFRIVMICIATFGMANIAAAQTAGPTPTGADRFYRIHTITANDEPRTGTNADVSVVLYDANGNKSIEMPLRCTGCDPFEPGYTDAFTVSTPTELGEITKITIKHNNAFPFPHWKPRTVDVQRMDNNNRPLGDKIWFDVNRWLATDRGLRKTEFTVERRDINVWRKAQSEANSLGSADAVGKWVRHCVGGQGCDREVRMQIVSGTAMSTEVQNAVASAFGVALSTETGFLGNTVEVEVSAEFSASTQLGEAFKSSFEESQGSSCSNSLNFIDFDIHSVWQRVYDATFENGQTVTAKTCEITCRRDGSMPPYGPNDAAAIGACLVKRGQSESPRVLTSVSQPVTPANGAVHHGVALYLQNKYDNWGTYLDTRGSGCEGGFACVSASSKPDESYPDSSTWRIISAYGTNTNDAPLKYGDLIHLMNTRNGVNSFLDTNGGGCETNKLCVSTSAKPDRAQVRTGVWKIVSVDGAKPIGALVMPGDSFHVENQWTGGPTFLDTNGGGCEGNRLCVSASDKTHRSNEGTGIWRISLK